MSGLNGWRLERAELLTPIPRADVTPILEHGGRVEVLDDCQGHPGGVGHFRVEPMVLAVRVVPPERRPAGALGPADADT